MIPHIQSENNITIMTKDNTYIISNGDIRFEKLYNKINSLSYEEVVDICTYKFLTKNKFISVKDNQIFINDKPATLGISRLLSHEAIYGNGLDSLVNFFINIENTSLDKEKSLEILQNNSAYSLTSDGFCLVLNQDIETTNTPFYVCKDKSINSLIQKGNNLESILNKFLNFKVGKKIQNIIKENIQKPENHHLYLDQIKSIQQFGDLFNESQWIDLLKNNKNLNQRGMKDFFTFFFQKPKRIFNAIKELNLIKIESLISSFNKINKDLEYPNVKFSYKNLEPIEKFIKSELIKKHYKDLCLNRYDFIRNLDEFTIGEYKLVIPSTSYDLEHWGQLMNNCIGGRTQSVLNGTCIPLALFQDNKIKYCFEILNRERFGHFEAKGRGAPSRELLQIVFNFLKDKGFIDTSKNISYN